LFGYLSVNVLLAAFLISFAPDMNLGVLFLSDLTSSLKGAPCILHGPFFVLDINFIKSLLLVELSLFIRIGAVRVDP